MPILLMTAYDWPAIKGEAVAALESGMNAHIYGISKISAITLTLST